MTQLQGGAVQGMSIDDSELREYTHGLFGSMAGVLKQDFQPFLATCVAAALASCEQVSQQHLFSLLGKAHARMRSSKSIIMNVLHARFINLIHAMSQSAMHVNFISFWKQARDKRHEQAVKKKDAKYLCTVHQQQKTAGQRCIPAQKV